jgi:hypothetical protein
MTHREEQIAPARGREALADSRDLLDQGSRGRLIEAVRLVERQALQGVDSYGILTEEKERVHGGSGRQTPCSHKKTSAGPRGESRLIHDRTPSTL